MSLPDATLLSVGLLLIATAVSIFILALRSRR